MADLSDLKTRIASELHRSDLTTQIASAITTAIAFYRSSRFEFNQTQASFNTAASQEVYTTATFPDDVGQIDDLRVTVNGRRVDMEPVGFKTLQRISTSTATLGTPSMWAWYAQQLYFYPIPDAIYSVSISYQQRKDAPTVDSDGATIWTNQCEALIRACARKIIARDFTYDEAEFQRMQGAEAEALSVLKRESRQLQDDGSPIQAND